MLKAKQLRLDRAAREDIDAKDEEGDGGEEEVRRGRLRRR